ncbi:MAG: hypothetical protein JWN00_4307 [Actinomycetia bacterium]|nr:hypothetical protein [Actinomycetes bacterium]
MESGSLSLGAVRDRRPLSVQVYDQLLTALHDSHLAPGDALPSETELAKQLGVSRTVLREALLLLEEDGALERGAGRRRVVAARPAQSSTYTSPLEEMVRATQPLAPILRRTSLNLASRYFSRRLLDLAEDAEVAVWETVFGAGDQPVCSALEFIPAAGMPEPARALTDADAPLEAAPGSLLHVLGPQFRARTSPVLWRITGATTQTRRVAWMNLPDNTPMVALTIVLARDGVPVYLAKHLIRLDMAELAIAPGPALPSIESLSFEGTPEADR